MNAYECILKHNMPKFPDNNACRVLTASLRLTSLDIRNGWLMFDKINHPNKIFKINASQQN